jgi:hypothetical protein
METAAPVIELPEDLTDLGELHASLCDSRQARPGVRAVLAMSGELLIVAGGEMASRRAYLRALVEWCAQVGIPVERVIDHDRRQGDRSHAQLVDEPRARRLREKMEDS